MLIHVQMAEIMHGGCNQLVQGAMHSHTYSEIQLMQSQRLKHICHVRIIMMAKLHDYW